MDEMLKSVGYHTPRTHHQGAESPDLRSWALVGLSMLLALPDT